MSRKTTVSAAFFSITLAAGLAAPARATDVVLCTDEGRIIFELFDEQAPEHVANFLNYMDQGYYTGTVFHRVIEDFMIQGGGHDRDLRRKPTLDPVPNESMNGVSNARGTLAAARTDDPDSATSQFFINLSDNDGLDGSATGLGYTVFGRVREGMRVVDDIAALPTGPGGQFAADVTDPLVAITATARYIEPPFPELADDDRLDEIRRQISDRIDAEDLVAAATWFDAYHSECGEMTADLRITEATVWMVTNRKPTSVAALNEYFRIASPRHGSYEVAQALYEMLVPDGAENIVAAPSAALAQLAGQCLVDELPELPDGGTATLDEMIAAQEAVRDFMARSEDSIDCLDEASKERELTDDQRSLLIRAHNDTVDVMEEIAGTFNAQIGIFRERE
ncbi:MAG: peptidylprolyl isomerase [Gammaproteobacteria bacterium]|nr:peptidylprolyl isomerase [Gammaproteobacteria bacterium]MDH3509199.1 peptidylprolyl isomerase [Gammaproteobacteria bacterium]